MPAALTGHCTEALLSALPICAHTSLSVPYRLSVARMFPSALVVNPALRCSQDVIRKESGDESRFCSIPLVSNRHWPTSETVIFVGSRISPILQLQSD